MDWQKVTFQKDESIEKIRTFEIFQPKFVCFVFCNILTTSTYTGRTGFTFTWSFSGGFTWPLPQVIAENEIKVGIILSRKYKVKAKNFINFIF